MNSMSSMNSVEASMRSLTDQELRGFLKDEYLLLQDEYEDFDRRTLTIKGWIGTGAFAALALAFNSSSKHAYIFPILIAILASIFWYLEAYWKLFQQATADRIRIIEAYFREDPDVFEKSPAPFQAFHRFSLSYKPDEPIYEYETKEKGRPRPMSRRLGALAKQGFVCQPYLTIILLGTLFFIILLTRK
jgi:hypothetical protein